MDQYKAIKIGTYGTPSQSAKSLRHLQSPARQDMYLAGSFRHQLYTNQHSVEYIAPWNCLNNYQKILPSVDDVDPPLEYRTRLIREAPELCKVYWRRPKLALHWYIVDYSKRSILNGGMHPGLTYSWTRHHPNHPLLIISPLNTTVTKSPKEQALRCYKDRAGNSGGTAG